jgi:tetratricopeptide (TPR) repeat protein
MGAVVSQTRDHEVPRDILERFAAGEASEEERRQVFRHLLAGCAACRRQLRLARWHSEAREMQLALANVAPLGPRANTYDEAFAAMQRTAMSALERRHAGAEVLLAELAEMSAEEREFKVRNVRRYADGKLAAALVEKSFELRYSDLPAMLQYARIAVAAAEAATPETAGGRSLLSDCRARAWAQLGNARRIHGDLAEAERCFTEALRHVEAGSGEPGARAWVVRLLASRVLADAVALNDEAVELYRRLRDRTGEATALIGGAWARIVAGDPRAAIAPLQRCLEILHPWHPQEQKLIQSAAVNLVLAYVDVGCPQDAYNTVILGKPYFEEGADTIALLRWDWQWGKADRDRGQFFSAELHLDRVREGFELEGLAEEVGEVSLDLAMLYARQGHRGKFLRAIAEAVAIFNSLGAKREYLAALAQLNAMAQEEEAAVTLLRELVLQCRGGVPRAER